MIEVHELTKDYGEKRAVDGLTFEVRPGVVTGFLGPNGSGKSTTMRLILGLDPEGIQWVRNLLRRLAGEGRTVFVSSHLMSEMAQTADHLIVIGRGKLIADTPVADFVARASKDIVNVRTPQRAELEELVTGLGATVTVHEDGLLEVRGLTPPQIGELAAENRIVLHELSPHLASLEEAFMDITRGELEFGAEAVG